MTDPQTPATQPDDHEQPDPGWKEYPRLLSAMIGREGWTTLGIFAGAWVVTAAIGITALVLAGDR